MGKIAKNNLGYLGSDFQYKLVNAFIEKPSFFKDLYSIIDQNMFTENYLRVIVGVMKEYCEKHNSVPSYDMITIKLNEIAVSELENQYYTETIEMLRNITTEGIDEIEDMAEKFFKQQNWVRVANEIRKIAGDGDMSRYDECQKLIETAMSIGRHTDESSSPYDNVESDLSKEDVVTIPTGVSKLDNSLGGGLDKGKIGLIIGSAGFGKTSMTTCFAANAATSRTKSNNYKGFKVLQICFEDAPRDIRRKYMSKITQVETCKLNESDETTQKVKTMLENYVDQDLIKNNIRIMKLESGEITSMEIKNIIQRKINEGFKPDMVVIDYFECLKYDGSTRDSEWVQEGKTMRKFENMAKELDVAFWIPTQGGRDSFSSQLVTMDQGGGSIKKQQIAQVVISITRSVDDVKDQKATLALLKNRSGAAGITLNGITFNNGTCTISCDDVIEFDDALSYNGYAEEQEAKRIQGMVNYLMTNT